MSNSKFLCGRQLLAIFSLALVLPSLLLCQSSTSSTDSTSVRNANVVPEDVNQRRIFGIIPNYRTASFPNPYLSISTGEKFSLATQDAFDRGTFVLAAAFGGVSQLSNSNPSFEKARPVMASILEQLMLTLSSGTI